MTTINIATNVCFMLGSLLLFAGTLMSTLHQLGVLK